MAAITLDIEELVPLTQVAAELGVSRSCAYIDAVAGRLAARQVAGRFVVTRADLEAFKKSEAARLARAGLSQRGRIGRPRKMRVDLVAA